MRASHRTRLTLTASAAVAILLAIVFLGVWAIMRQSEMNGAKEYLDAGLTAAVADLKLGKKPDMALWEKNHSQAKLNIFVNGKAESDPQFASNMHGYGLADLKGKRIVFRSADVKGKTAVDYLDWTQWSSNLHQVSLALIALFPLLVGIVALVTWQSAKATFRPLQEMSYQAAAIGGSDFTARIDVEDAAEFGLFAAQLNALLARIEDAVRAQEQFAADAAHELRTPLTVMRGKIETALLTSRTPEEYSKTLRALLKEVERLTRLSEALLESARPERLNAPLFNVEPAVWEVASRWLDRFVAKKVRLEVNSGPANVNIRREEMACVLDNLLANALRYSPPGSVCEINLVESEAGVVLSVQDEGTGIQGGGLQAFERFWREDGARSRGSGGFGIGLAVCKRLVESRSGKITVDSDYKKGARICISFPNPTVASTPGHAVEALRNV
jgi:signal transduction histidine kinase